MPLEIQSLLKRFGDRAVLNGISATVQDGEFFVLLGPSGGGKSTILRVLCGIEKADAGSVTLNGRDITNLPPRDRNIGMVFQDYGLYPHMNAYGNIAYGLEARGMPKNEVDQRVREAAGKLGLTPLLERIIVDLSGGEQQRVALARALAKDADLYLFDEPISNLDPKLRAQARRDILMVHRAKGKPTLYVTHDQNEALAIGDRIAIVAKGQLQQVGTADDLIQHPANLFVAGFIGSPPMNLLPGTLTHEGGLSVRVSPTLTVPLPEKWHATGYHKDKIVLGLPPAAFFLPGSIGHEDKNGIPLEGEIVDFEPLISEIVVTLRLDEGVTVSAIFQELEEDQVQIGNRMQMYVDSEQIALFDPETELAL
ncbi:MAG: ABC transporter ATP-binding protein [Anaerolineales bacterium]|nr:ABC transporter ATP-binding protein [Anaerolineales bacterium]